MGFHTRIHPSPIGGYKEIGTVQISNHTRFSKLEESDIDYLNEQITEKCLFLESYGIHNILIYGEDTENGFNLSIIPYPTCSWIEKITGLYHAIFGAPELSSDELDSIKKNRSKDVNKTGERPPMMKGFDPFSNPEILARQRIYTAEEIEILTDNRPKGAVHEDEHLLIVPQDDRAYVDGSALDRKAMLLEAQKVAEFLEENCEKLLIIERIGNNLASVPHKHMHVTQIRHVPATWVEKVCAFFRQILPAALSGEALENRVRNLKQLLEID
jgi:diadenosine tetraphosphate (Ap4A) HIT family hydrolase